MKLASKIALPKEFVKGKSVRISTISAQKWKDHWVGYLFLSPCIALFSVFLFYPLVKSVYLSLHLTNGRGQVVEYVGLENFIRLFQSTSFYSSLKVTVWFTLYTVPTGIIIALLLAALTHNRFKGMMLYKFVFSLPIAISVATGSVIWLLLFHPTNGMLNYFLSLIGQAPVFWLVDPNWALFSVSIMTVWMNLGFNYIIILSGLQGIPDDIYDSAKIDGAGPARSFWSIIIPLLSPTLFFVLIVSVIGAFQTFGQIHILTKGGPVHTTNVIVYQIYQEAFINFRFGTGSAQALILFAIILALTFIQFKVLERKVHYQ